MIDGDSVNSIPKKSYFKLNEVCSLTGIKPYILRFWESEFTDIRPITSASGQKIYTYKDIETINLIKKSLIDDKMSINDLKNKFAGIEVATLPETPAKETIAIIKAAPVMRLKDSIDSRDEDIALMILAKEKLQGILALSDRIKTRHHWA